MLYDMDFHTGDHFTKKIAEEHQEELIEEAQQEALAEEAQKDESDDDDE